MSSSRTDDPLTVLVVTVNEYYYIPRFLMEVLDADAITVVGVTTVPPSLGTESLLSFGYDLFRRFGPRVFTKHAAFYAKHLALDWLNRARGSGNAYSPRTLARRRGVEYRHVRDVNAEDYLRYARRKSPDVIASVAATQQFDAELLDVPSEGAINVHASRLPEYRGVSPSFWALRNDEDTTGVTVHFVDEALDAGDVVVQRPLEIRDDDTLHSLNARVAERGSEALLEALERIASGTVRPEPIDIDDGEYYSLPDRGDVRAFIEQGRRFY